MLDDSGMVIYVGKAKILKNRVKQYFQASKNHSPKVLAMVSHISDFDTIVVESEVEALSLESNLIKEYLPKYNILLKDDKHFPYFRIDLKQDYPRIEIVRRVKQDGAVYLGPYVTGPSIHEDLKLAYDLYPIRHCKKNIQSAIAKRERPCLLFHIGKCCAPCSGNVTKEEYHALLTDAIKILNGKSDDILSVLEKKMQNAADEMDFERAAMLRDRIRALRAMQEKQIAISVKGLNADVFAAAAAENSFMIFGLFVRDGKIIGTHAFPMESEVESSLEDLRSAFLMQYYLHNGIEIMSHILIDGNCADESAIETLLTKASGHKVEVSIPARGEKRKLIDLALKNCHDLLEKNAQLRIRSWERGEGALIGLAEALNLDAPPKRIECFDNSHLFGTNNVSSMVVFTNGQPDKQEYRHFRISTVIDGNDLESMRTVLNRRFIKEDHLPDLLLLDGGETQLSIGVEVLKETGHPNIPIAAIAESEEIIYIPGQKEAIYLPRNSATLHLVQRIRDEAHRFAVSYHRNVRSRTALSSQLDQIPGIGEKRKRALFDAFLTSQAIAAASVDQINEVPGINRTVAKAVYDYYHPESAFAPSGPAD